MMEVTRLIATLLQRPEGTTLDFKRCPYRFGASPQEKAKLLKDLLAMANVISPDDRYILVGVDAESSDRKQVVGIEDHLDDAMLQNFVLSKLNRQLQFSYQEIIYEDKRIGLITINAQQRRPLYSRSNVEDVHTNVVYTRHGSSNGEISPDDWIHLVQEGQKSPRSLGERVESVHGESLRLLTERWLSIFLNHKLTLSQIPTVMPGFGLKVAALGDWRRLLDLLSEDLLTRTCEMFNVSREWLDGESPCPYEPIAHSYQIMEWVNAIADMKRQYDDVEVLAFKDGTPDKELRSQAGALILSAPVFKFGNRKWIERYVPAASFGGWDYPRGRKYAKTMLWVAKEFKCWFRGLTADSQTIREIYEGDLFISNIVGKGLTWHPDDYVFSPEESLVAKQSDEYDIVLAEARRAGLYTQVKELKRQLRQDGKL